jgi:hypothetical protein
VSIIQGPFSVAPCQTLVSRFATFSSLYVTTLCHPPQTVPAPVLPATSFVKGGDRRTWPSGDGSSGNAECENTGAVASRPSGEKKLLAVNSVNTSSSRMPSCRIHNPTRCQCVYYLLLLIDVVSAVRWCRSRRRH